MTTTRLYVVRHGQSTHNQDKLISGYSENPALTEQGIAEAKATQKKLSHIHFDEAYSSDLQRAAHTAKIIYGQEVHPSKQITNLRERAFGTAEGKPQIVLDEFRDDPSFQALTEEQRWFHKFADDMESDHEVATRFIGALENIAQENVGKTLLVAAHGGTLRTLLISLGYATNSELPFGSIDNASFVEIIYKDGKFTVGELGGIHKATV
jgi:broad specificity phosphatase PhoE